MKYYSHLIIFMIYFIIESSLMSQTNPLQVKSLLFFPESLKTNPKNNSGIVFFTERLNLQKKMFVIHKGKEGFYLNLTNPINTTNHIFSIKGQCTILEGKFYLYLLVKNDDKNIIKILPVINSHPNIKFLEEKQMQSFKIEMNEELMYKYIKPKTFSRNALFKNQIIGFLIEPFTNRTVFYCDAFELQFQPILWETL